MKRFFFRLLGVFIAGMIASWILVTFTIPNPQNPLHPKLSLKDAFIIWHNKAPLKRCLQEVGQPKIYECVNGVLRRVARSYGAGTALALIEPISQENPILLSLGHDLAHTIGNNALYASYGMGAGLNNIATDVLVQKMGKVIVDCDGWGSFGCYHGVIEVALSRFSPQERTSMIQKACLENPLVLSKLYYLNQCMHWFGHGMAIFTEQTLEQTLAVCESVDTSFDSDPVQLCISGVFHAGALPGTSDKTFLGNVTRVYDPDDPYFPCLSVEERFKGHCFSHTVGRTHSGDLAVMMGACNNIPERDAVKKRLYVQLCYESIGNNLLIAGDFAAAPVADTCKKLALDEYMGFCFGGAARYSALRNPLLNNLLPFQICALAPDQAKKTCYALTGFANFENYKLKSVLSAYCANAESDYRKACEALNP